MNNIFTIILSSISLALGKKSNSYNYISNLELVIYNNETRSGVYERVRKQQQQFSSYIKTYGTKIARILVKMVRARSKWSAF